MRDGKGRFQKGESGNPRGRPRKSAAADGGAEAMLKKAAEEAVRVLTETMRSKDVKAELRVSCATEVLSRVYGKGGSIPSARQEEGGGEVRFTFSGEAERYAQ